MSTGGQTAVGRDIPATRRVTIHDAAQMPKDCCATPGGTLFSTTPGGTRIIYDRKFLLQCRTSPLARTPPSLPDIPGVTRPHKPQCSSQTDTANPEKNTNINSNPNLQTDESTGEEPLFDMDI